MRELLEVGLVLGAWRRSDQVEQCWLSLARLFLALMMRYVVLLAQRVNEVRPYLRMV